MCLIFCQFSFGKDLENPQVIILGRCVNFEVLLSGIEYAKKYVFIIRYSFSLSRGTGQGKLFILA